MTPYENVTFKERLHEEAAKLKEMSFRDKFWYIWEYYKFPIIGVVIAVFLVGSIGGAMYNNRFDTALSCAVLNSRYDSEALTVDQYFNEGFRAFIGLDENTKIDVDYSMSPSFDESAMNEYSYAELAKLTAMISSKGLDVMIGRISQSGRSPPGGFIRAGKGLPLSGHQCRDRSGSVLRHPHRRYLLWREDRPDPGRSGPHHYEQLASYRYSNPADSLYL